MRGFDSSQLYRKDALERMKWLSDGIVEYRRKIQKTKGKLSEREKRNRRIKSELRTINRTLEQTQAAGTLPKIRRGLRDTVKVRLTWQAFSELRCRYPDRVLDNMNTGRFLFADTSVILHIPFYALGKPPNTLIH